MLALSETKYFLISDPYYIEQFNGVHNGFQIWIEFIGVVVQRKVANFIQLEKHGELNLPIEIKSNYNFI